MGCITLTFGVRTLNLLMFLPNIVTPVVAALFLRWIFIGRWGLLSATLIGLGIFPPDFLGNPAWARVTVVLADSWQFTPFMILVLYAGLNTVDQSQIEAAQIDGAGIWMMLFRIMLPSIRPLIVFVLAIRLMDAFRFFDTIYVLTAGGPGTATETITLYTYALAFRLLQIGKASALGVLTLLFVAVLIAVHDPAGLSARTRCLLMRRRGCARRCRCSCCCARFTAVNLTPVIWGVLTSIKQPVDAFSVPPKLIFAPTFEFH